MATTRAALGQTGKPLFAAAFTDATGAATDPTGTPTIKVYYVDPAGSLTLKATLNLAKLVATTGWWGAFQDISDATVWPAGDYQLLGNATVGGIATDFTDTFEIDAAPTSFSGGFVAGGYCSEAQVRLVAAMLSSTVEVTSPTILEMVVRASREIDMRLRSMFVVPFSATYDDGIVLICIWLATGYVFENLQAQRGNENILGATLIARAEAALIDILNGKITLSVDQRSDVPDGSGVILSSTIDRTPAASITDENSPLFNY